MAIQLTTPISEEAAAALRVGDTVEISGYILCGRDAVLPKVLKMIENGTAGELGVRMPVGNLFSSDTFYDAAASSMQWARMGCMAVEMEAAALYCNAAYTNKRALAICSISDSLVTGEELNAEERQNSFTNMMKIALEVAVKATRLPDLAGAEAAASK